MTSRKLAVVVLAAGKGTRMKTEHPKVLHRIAGRAMIDYVLEAARGLDPAETVVVIGPGMEALREAVAPLRCALQEAQLGTADAVRTATDLLGTELDETSDVLVLCGDGPLITGETLRAMVAARQGTEAPDFVWLGFTPPDPTGYGRMVVDGEGQLAAIVEEKDASEAERAIGLCWAGLLLAAGKPLVELLAQVDNDNAKGEYYLTQLVALAGAAGRTAAVVSTEAADEVRGINSRVELAEAEALMQARLRAAAMAGGATLIDPATVWLSHDTRLGRDVVVHPNVFFGPGVTVEDGAEIRAFSHLEGARVGAGARIGPFARLRPGAEIGEAAAVGNFVEVKAAKLGPGAKANHLSYLGDAEVGAKANIGAGTITCNYDGFAKHRTAIGADAFIGSNTALVAPVSVGAGAIVAAGSTVTKNVPDDALAVARGAQSNKLGLAARFRRARKKG
jgi:bifunctional UDP-N-acetylglucosamine pyrophosphorylase/glucosamine-1-phosphate N-acetyltransferase